MCADAYGVKRDIKKDLCALSWPHILLQDHACLHMLSHVLAHHHMALHALTCPRLPLYVLAWTRLLLSPMHALTLPHMA